MGVSGINDQVCLADPVDESTDLSTYFGEDASEQESDGSTTDTYFYTPPPPLQLYSQPVPANKSPLILHDADASVQIDNLRDCKKQIPLAGGLFNIHYKAGAHIKAYFPYAGADLQEHHLPQASDGSIMLAGFSGVQLELNTGGISSALAKCNDALLITFFLALQQAQKLQEKLPKLADLLKSYLQIPVTGLFLRPQSLEYNGGKSNLVLCVGLDISHLPYVEELDKMTPLVEGGMIYLPVHWAGNFVPLTPINKAALNPHFDWATGLDSSYQQIIWESLVQDNANKQGMATVVTDILPTLDDINLSVQCRGMNADVDTGDFAASMNSGDISVSYTPWESIPWQAAGEIDFSVHSPNAPDKSFPILSGWNIFQNEKGMLDGEIIFDVSSREDRQFVPEELWHVVVTPDGAGINLDGLSLSEIVPAIQSCMENIVFDYIIRLGDVLLTSGRARIENDDISQKKAVQLKGNTRTDLLTDSTVVPEQLLNYSVHLDPKNRGGDISLSTVTFSPLPGIEISTSLEPSHFKAAEGQIVLDALIHISTPEEGLLARPVATKINVIADLARGKLHLRDIAIPLPQPLIIDVMQNGSSIIIEDALLHGELNYDMKTGELDGPLVVSTRNTHSRGNDSSEDGVRLIFADGIKTKTTFTGMVNPVNAPQTNKRDVKNGFALPLTDFDLVIESIRADTNGTKVIFHAQTSSRNEYSPELPENADASVNEEKEDLPLVPLGKPHDISFSNKDIAYSDIGLSEETAALAKNLLPKVDSGSFILDGIAIDSNNEESIMIGPFQFSIPENFSISIFFDIKHGRLTRLDIVFSDPLKGPFDLAGFHFDVAAGKFKIDAARESADEAPSFIEGVSINSALFRMLGFSNVELMAKGINPRHLSNRADIFLELYLRYLEKKHDAISLTHRKSPGYSVDMSHARLAGKNITVAGGTNIDFKGLNITLDKNNSSGRPSEFDFQLNIAKKRLDLQSRHIGNANVTLDSSQTLLDDAGKAANLSAEFSEGRIGNIRISLKDQLDIRAQNIVFSHALSSLHGKSEIMDGAAKAQADIKSYADLRIFSASLVEKAADDHDKILLNANFETRVDSTGAIFSLKPVTQDARQAEIIIGDSTISGDVSASIIRKVLTDDSNGILFLPKPPRSQLYLEQADFTIKSDDLYFPYLAFSPGVVFADSRTRQATLVLRTGREKEFSIDGEHNWKLAEATPSLPIKTEGILNELEPVMHFEKMTLSGSATDADSYGYAKMDFDESGFTVSTDPSRPLIMSFTGGADFHPLGSPVNTLAHYTFSDQVTINNAHLDIDENKMVLSSVAVSDWNSDFHISHADLPPIPGLPDDFDIPLTDALGHLHIESAELGENRIMQVKGSHVKLEDSHYKIEMGGNVQTTKKGIIMDDTQGKVTLKGRHTDSEVVFVFGEDMPTVHYY